MAVQQLLIQDLERRGVSRTAVIQAMIASRNEQELVEEFRSGKFKKPDGSLYTSFRMTKFWKEESQKRGLVAAQRELASLEIPGVELPDGGMIGLVGRIMDLTKRYEDNLMVRREMLEEIHAETSFDFVVDGCRFLGYMDLVAKVKPEFRHLFGDKSWILVDYKTGKAKDLLVHTEDSHKSLQLSLYHHAISEELQLCSADDLYMSLHYLDAQFPAATQRTKEDFNQLIKLAKIYQTMGDSPGMVKRLFYEGGCEYCELKPACIKHFGLPTSACGQTATQVVSDDLHMEDF